jgi:two-component system, cell cycle sensor histidine kinase and response regulator CckA
VHTAPGAGTVFRVLFPAADGQRPRSLTPRSVVGAPRSGTILVIDDEDAVRDVARRMLERSGYRVLTASDGDAGLETFLQQEADILAIVLDVTMPRMNGTEVLAELRMRGSRVPVVLASGYSEESLAPPAEGESAPVFVQKPFSTGNLLAGLDAALARILTPPQ